MKRELGRQIIATAARVGSVVTAFLAGQAAADTRAVPHNAEGPARISGYISAGSERSTVDAFNGGPVLLRRDALQGASAPVPASGSFFLDVRHDGAQ